MSNICIDCGLCCDGTMYSRVDLVEGDSIEFFQRVGLQLGDLRDERVADVFGPHSFQQLYKVARPKLEAMQGAARPLAQQAELLLDIGAMNVLLTRYFRLPAKEPCETGGRQATGDHIESAMGH